MTPDTPPTTAERNRRIRVMIAAAKARRKAAMLPPANHMPDFPEHWTATEMEVEMARRLPPDHPSHDVRPAGLIGFVCVNCGSDGPFDQPCPEDPAK